MRLRRARLKRRRAAGLRIVAVLLLQLPAFLRLLFGLLADRRVSRLDKALLAAVVAYILTPFDLIPDFLAVLGQVDDLFLLGLALNRLLARTQASVLLSHWRGSREGLELLLGGLAEVGSLLPRGVRRTLRRRVLRSP